MEAWIDSFRGTAPPCQNKFVGRSRPQAFNLPPPPRSHPEAAGPGLSQPDTPEHPHFIHIAPALVMPRAMTPAGVDVFKAHPAWVGTLKPAAPTAGWKQVFRKKHQFMPRIKGLALNSSFAENGHVDALH
ncbi:MAG: hypothetical protein EA399_15135 [Desulfovibrionales bacterium]|nr:MAG: hypothetical protein EA399_15135 [Desulfovibrionales bacterium]